MKEKKPTTLGTIPKPNIKITESGKIDTSNTNTNSVNAGF